MLKVAVLVSGGGTNLQALIDGVENGRIPNVKISLVISNKPGAKALERAEKAGIRGMVVNPKDYADRKEFDAALLKVLQEEAPDLIVLAGYLVAIPAVVVEAFPNRIINIHPSLIPSFCGKGFYGLHVHEAVLARGVRVTGATVHFVDAGMDTGPILLQRAVEVKQDDTPEQLQRRVMEQAEWKILPEAVALIAAGAVEVRDGRAYVKEATE